MDNTESDANCANDREEGVDLGFQATFPAPVRETAPRGNTRQFAPDYPISRSSALLRRTSVPLEPLVQGNRDNVLLAERALALEFAFCGYPRQAIG
jgi:hypothetical protein